MQNAIEESLDLVDDAAALLGLVLPPLWPEGLMGGVALVSGRPITGLGSLLED